VPINSAAAAVVAAAVAVMVAVLFVLCMDSIASSPGCPSHIDTAGQPVSNYLLQKISERRNFRQAKDYPRRDLRGFHLDMFVALDHRYSARRSGATSDTSTGEPVTASRSRIKKWKNPNLWSLI
jgi:hypothetical protein